MKNPLLEPKMKINQEVKNPQQLLHLHLHLNINFKKHLRVFFIAHVLHPPTLHLDHIQERHYLMG